MEAPLHAAGYDPVTGVADRLFLARHRRAIASGVSGRVLDVGTGTGRMLPYLHHPGQVDLFALERDPHMRRRARDRVAALGADVTFIDADATAMPIDDGAFDVVVASMLLCTVDDVDRTLDEIARILRPGGAFRFVEHVASHGPGRVLQRSLAPAWRRLAQGCHLTRETAAHIEGHPDLEALAMQRLGTGITPVRPFIRGRALAR